IFPIPASWVSWKPSATAILSTMCEKLRSFCRRGCTPRGDHDGAGGRRAVRRFQDLCCRARRPDREVPSGGSAGGRGVSMLGVGATFAGYQVERVLGQGGMGTVYLARHPRLPRNVALKLLNREVSTDAELTRRFEREADVVARLEHPGIVGVFDRGAEDGHLWIAMQ